MNREVVRTSNFARDASEFILQQARIALGERGEFRIALSGGNTPRLSMQSWRAEITSCRGNAFSLPSGTNAASRRMTSKVTTGWRESRF